MEVGKKLKEAREKKGLSQRELAKLSNVSYAQISRIESDQKLPGCIVLQSLCYSLGVSADYILGLSDENYKHKYEELVGIIHRADILEDTAKGLRRMALERTYVDFTEMDIE